MGQVAIVSIHGTFAKNAAWVQADSLIMRRIIEDLASRGDSCEVLPFRWSGSNTFAARRHAGEDLAAFIEGLASGGGATYDEMYLIAHSHGGSVVAHAVDDYPHIKSMITGVVTLSTPWFSVRAEKFAVENRLFITRCASLLFLCGILLVSVPLITWLITSEILPPAPESIYKGVEFGEEGSMYRDPLFVWVVLMALISLFIAFPVGAIIGTLWAIVHMLLIRKLSNTEHGFMQSIQTHAVALNTAGVLMPPTIVLVASNDEAASGLRVVGWLSAVSREVFGRLARLVWSLGNTFSKCPIYLRAPAAVILFALFSIVCTWFGIFSVILGEGLPAIITFCVGFLLLLFSAFIGMSVLSGISFGSFSIFAQAYCRFNVEPCPFGSTTLVLVNTATKLYMEKSWCSSLLNHSAIYLFDEGIDAACAALLHIKLEASMRNNSVSLKDGR